MQEKMNTVFEQGCYLILLNIYMCVHKIILVFYVLNNLVDVFYFSLVLYNAIGLLIPTLNSYILHLGEGKDQRNRKTV